MIYGCKITNIRLIRMQLPGDVWDIVILETDSGLRGWGDVSSSMDIEGVSACFKSFEKFMLSRSPLARENIIRDLERWSYPNLNNLRCFRTALSGIDQCLWDLCAKIYGIPLYKFYGASEIQSIPLYANLNKALRDKRDANLMGEHARKAKEAGFDFLKVTPFDEIHPSDWILNFTKTFEKLDAITKFMPMEKIALDCHQRFTRHSLCQMIDKVLERYGMPFWIEDTVAINDYESQRIVVAKYPEIRFAAGEDAINIPAIKDIIDSGLYDVIMPDVKYVGGPTVVLTLIHMMNSLDRIISLHNPNGLIATAHSAHLSTLVTNGAPMEFPFLSVPDRACLAYPTEKIEAGCYVLNGEPGIGIELKDEAIEEFGIEYTGVKLNKYRRIPK